MITFTLFKHARCTTPHDISFTWPNLCAHFDLASQSPFPRPDKLAHLAYIPGTLTGSRCAANVENLTFGSYDVDVPGDAPNYVAFAAMQERLESSGLSYMLVTSTKSLKSDNRYRLILPFDKSVAAHQHVQMWHHVNAQFGGIFDKSTHDPSRLSFFPAQWHGLPRRPNGTIIRDWPQHDAFQAFACRTDGNPFPVPTFTAVAPSVQTIVSSRGSRGAKTGQAAGSSPLSSAAIELLEACAAMVPPKESAGYRLATAPGNAWYCGNDEFGLIQGGRMFRFLSRVAARALGQRLPIDSDLLFDLAQAVDLQHGISDRRDLMREVTRALERQAERIAALPNG